MRGAFFLALIVICGQVSHAWTDDCTTVDMAAPGGSMEHVPPTTASANDCYADTAAYMASAFVQAHLPDVPTVNDRTFRVSPDILDAGIGAGDSQVLDTTSGRVCNSLDWFAQHGVCNQNAMDKLMAKAANSSGDHSDWVDMIDYECNSAIHPVRYSGQPAPKPQTPAQAAQHVAENFKNNLKFPKELIPGQSVILAAIESDHPGVIAEAESNLFCSLPGNSLQLGGDIPSIPACQKFDFQSASTANGKKQLQSPEAFEAKLHTLLVAGGNKGMPIGIEYCEGVLRSGDGNFITNRTFENDLNYLNDASRSTENLDSKCLFHASVLIGQMKKPDGKCYFEIQSSDGSSCAVPSTSQPPRECDKNGRIWVPADVLSRNMIRADYF